MSVHVLHTYICTYVCISIYIRTLYLYVVYDIPIIDIPTHILYVHKFIISVHIYVRMYVVNCVFSVCCMCRLYSLVFPTGRIEGTLYSVYERQFKVRKPV